VIPNGEYGNLQKDINSQHPHIYKTVTVTKIYANELKQVLKLQNHVLVWNVTDWNALSSLKIITTSSYVQTVDQYI